MELAFVLTSAPAIGTVILALIAASFCIFGNINQVKYGLPQARRFFKCPSAVTSGMPVLIGTMAAVAIDAYDSTLLGTVFELEGSYALTVVANSSQSPVSGLQVNPGDELFASGTLDATTGVTYNLTIDKTRGNTPFGNLDQSTPILAGVTNTSAIVRLKTGGSPGPYAP